MQNINRSINNLLKQGANKPQFGVKRRKIGRMNFDSTLEYEWYLRLRKVLDAHHKVYPEVYTRIWHEPIAYRANDTQYADKYVPDFVLALRAGDTPNIGEFTGSSTHLRFVQATCVPVEIKPDNATIDSIKNKLYLAYNPVLLLRGYPDGEFMVDVVETFGQSNKANWVVTNCGKDPLAGYFKARERALFRVAPEVNMEDFTVEKH